MSLLFLGSLGGWEMVAIVFVILLLFGGKKIPELMKGLGSGIREFNNAKMPSILKFVKVSVMLSEKVWMSQSHNIIK